MHVTGSTNNQFANRTIWQPTETASVNGISGNVCVELAFKNYIGQVGTGNGSSTSTVGPAGSQNHSVSATPTVGASSQTGGPGVQAGNGSLTSRHLRMSPRAHRQRTRVLQPHRQ
ncbi:MAG: hypothetical protein V8S27_10180 [Lachnospiraceae bacterium]